MDDFRLEPMIEATQSGKGEREVLLTIIRAGWGNKAHNHYYPAETLKRAATDKVFDGVKMYADHLSEGQRRILGALPRSVRDLTGRIIETWYDHPSQSLKGRAKLVPWFYDLVSSDPELVEASINAGGRAVPRRIEGREGRFVEAIVKGNSVDWVSLGGAGGKIDSLLESHMEGQKRMYDDLTIDGLVEGNPGLIKEILDGPLNERAEQAEQKLQEALAELEESKKKMDAEDAADGADDEESEGEGKTKKKGKPAWMQEAGIETAEDFHALIEAAAEKVAARVIEARDAEVEADRAFDKKVVALVEAEEFKALPQSAKTDIAAEFVGTRASYDSDEALTEAVQGRCKSRLDQLIEAGLGKVRGLGGSINTDDLREAAARPTGETSGANAMIDQIMGIDAPKQD